MPPKQKITQQMIIEAGYDIAKKNGIEKVNSRNISKLLSCSTQPVFSCFSTMEELKRSIFEFARKKIVNDGIKYVNSNMSLDFWALSIQWYLKLLRNEPHLYKLLFFLNGYGNGTPIDFISRYTSNDMVLSKMQTQYMLSLDTCKDILFRSYVLLHGIGTLIFFNGLEISDEKIIEMIKQTVTEMVLFASNESK